MNAEESISVQTQGQEEKVMSAVLNIAKGISRSGEGSLIIIAPRDDDRGAV